MKTEAMVEFLSAFFAEMRTAELNYAVLHEWRKLPCKVDSDIDMVIDKPGLARLPQVLRLVESRSGWRVVQKLWYDVPACHYHVAVSPDTKESVALDFLNDEQGIGEYRIKSTLLLEDCVETRGIRHMSSESELAYKLAKRRVKGVFKEKDLEFVRAVQDECDSGKLAKQLRSYMPCRVAEKAEVLLGSRAGLDEWNAFMKASRPGLRLPGMNWSFHCRPSWWFYMILRVCSRIHRDTGCVVYLDKDSVTVTDWDFGFVFRRVVTVSADALGYALKRKALMKTWLLVVTGNDGCGVECERGAVRNVSGSEMIRNVVIEELKARHERHMR